LLAVAGVGASAVELKLASKTIDSLADVARDRGEKLSVCLEKLD